MLKTKLNVIFNVTLNVILNITKLCYNSNNILCHNKTFYMKAGNIMNDNVVIKEHQFSFLRRYLFNIKINDYIKECKIIKESLKEKGIVKKEDKKVYLLISGNEDTDSTKNSFIFKGYNSDGSLKALRRFNIEDGKIEEAKETLKQDISVVDIYEKSVYLYKSTYDEKYVSGYIIKEKMDMNEEKTLVFTRDRVKVLHKNINTLVKFSEVENFINLVVI